MKVDLHTGRDGSAPVQRVEVVAVQAPRLGHGRRRDQERVVGKRRKFVEDERVSSSEDGRPHDERTIEALGGEGVALDDGGRRGPRRLEHEAAARVGRPRHGERREGAARGRRRGPELRGEVPVERPLVRRRRARPRRRDAQRQRRREEQRAGARGDAEPLAPPRRRRSSGSSSVPMLMRSTASPLRGSMGRPMTDGRWAL